MKGETDVAFSGELKEVQASSLKPLVLATGPV